MSGFCGYGDSVGIFTGFSVGIGWVKRKLLNTVKTRILWSHHEETWELPGERDNARNSARRRGRPRTAWMDNIKTWTELPVEESTRMTEDRDKWRKYVHGVANPRIEDG